MSADSQSDTSQVDTDKTQVDDTHDYETQARTMGWRPKEEYRGDPDHFVDAKTFYERGRTVLPILQATERALREELARVKADAQQAIQIAEKSREREVADLKVQLEMAKQARKEAVKEADGDRFEAAEEQVKELESAIADSSTSTKAQTPQLDPRYSAWLNRSEQAWLTGDEEAQAIAAGRAYLPKYKHLVGQYELFWDAVAKDTKKIMDATHAAQRADLDRPGPEGAGRGNGEVRARAGERSFANLTPEFKKQCDRQYKDFNISVPLEKWRERYVSGISEDAFRK